MPTKNRITPAKPSGAANNAMGENTSDADGRRVPIRLKNEKTDVRTINSAYAA
jgi:hypothetical protein